MAEEVVIVVVVLLLALVFGVGGYFVYLSLQKSDTKVEMESTPGTSTSTTSTSQPTSTTSIPKTSTSTTTAPTTTAPPIVLNESVVKLPDAGTPPPEYELMQSQPSFSGMSLYNTGVGCLEWNKHYAPLTVLKTPTTCTTQWNYEPTGALRSSKDSNTGRLYLGSGTGGFSVITGVEDNPLYWMHDESKWEFLRRKGGYHEYMIRNRGTKNCLINKDGIPTIGSCDASGTSKWHYS